MNRRFQVGVLLFDDVELLDFAGPMEVFSVANRVVDEPVFELHSVGANVKSISTHDGLSINPQQSLDSFPKPHVLVVPGGKGVDAQLENEEVIQWIRGSTLSAEITLSVCTGALLLAKAGLLAGQKATTHHSALDRLRAIEPGAEVIEGERFADNGNVICAAGISAGIDATLHLVARLLGPDIATAVAERMEYGWR